ncbi:hypothetical protein ACFVZM_01825 [Streptomyces sioyaensis]|uniref:hypothetical protein n=1 Tax=Streptomyces sioyaensis TaxID=67364 RepID=UPI00368CFEB4
MEPIGSERGPARYQPGEGCVTTVVRVPVRIVVLVLVVPVRLVWDVLTAAARAVHRSALSPLGRGLAWVWHTLVVRPLAWAWHTLVVAPLRWLWRTLVVAPAAWLWRWVLAPAGRGIGAVVGWLVRYLVVVPARWLGTYVLAPLGRGLAWLLRGLGAVLGALVRGSVVVPAAVLWRYVLGPAGRALAAVVTVLAREIGAALGHCWRAAGIVSRALGRFLAAVLRWTLVEPVRWVYRTVLTPVGQVIRDGLWRPVRQALRTARATVRQTRREIRRALFGAPREPRPARAVVPRREPGGSGARTLGETSGRDVSPPARG